MAEKKLQGKKIAILSADGFEQVELTDPRKALEEAGAQVEILSLKDGEIQGFEHHDKVDTAKVDRKVADARPDDYDGLFIPGGVINGDLLRDDADAVRFVADFARTRKPIASICHGPWILIEAGLLKGRTITSWPSLQTDVRNAGGTWVDAEVHVDAGLTTSRKPDDLPAFCAKLVEEFCEGVHEDMPQPEPEHRFAREGAQAGS